MQTEWNLRIILQHLQKRLIAVAIGLLEHTVKVANRLVIVKRQYQPYRTHHVHNSKTVQPVFPLQLVARYRRCDRQGETVRDVLGCFQPKNSPSECNSPPPAKKSMATHGP